MYPALSVCMFYGVLFGSGVAGSGARVPRMYGNCRYVMRSFPVLKRHRGKIMAANPMATGLLGVEVAVDLSKHC